MENKSTSWQERFGLTACSAETIAEAVPAGAVGVAVIYEESDGSDNVYLVIESRAGSLRDHCVKRLGTAKLPPMARLKVAFKGGLLSDRSAEAVAAACRDQVVFASQLRRELRPAMR